VEFGLVAYSLWEFGVLEEGVCFFCCMDFDGPWGLGEYRELLGFHFGGDGLLLAGCIAFNC